MIAVCKIKREPHYRREAFERGLKRAGYTLEEHAQAKGPDDLLLVWNRHGDVDHTAAAWEARGGTVIVCENGYIGRDADGRQFYAIAVHGHNGSGWFPVGAEDRFAQLGIDVAPWRDATGYDLICGQRGIGAPSMRSPANWHLRTATRLKAMRRNFRVRAHPGNFVPKTSLEVDLSGAGMCLVWSSSSGVKALTMGVPVAYCAPHWICAAGASKGIAGVDTPVRDDVARAKALHHMAWGQRSIAEIETGEVFVSIRERRGEARW